MTEDLNTIEAGDTLDVTIKTNGTKTDGSLTVVKNPDVGPVSVENSNGDKFELVIDRPDSREGVLGKHGDEVATVHNIRVA